MINVTKTYLPPIEDYKTYIEQIWQSGQITNNGPLDRELTKQLKEYLGVANLEYIANGTLSLQLAIKALGLKGEIITTPYSYVATTNAILWEGCKPVFVDIDERTFCIDPEKIEEAITEQTSAVLATHVYGYPCDVERIERIAKKHNLKVVYDAAHAFGVKLNGKSLVNHGDISTLSFHATKIFHTAEGGAIVCKDEEISKKIFLMKKFGHIGEDEYLDIGINAKNSEFHAAMGLCVLPKVESIINERKLLSDRYDELLAACDIRKLSAVDGLERNYAYYPVVFESNEQMMMVRNALLAQDIVPRRYFYPSLNTLPFLNDEQKASCPISESISSRVLCLPLFVGLSGKEQNTIASTVKNSI